MLQEASQAVQTLAEVAANQHEHMHHGNVTVEVNSDGTTQTVQLAEATLNADGHIILSSDAANALAGGNYTLIICSLSASAAYSTVVIFGNGDILEKSLPNSTSTFPNIVVLLKADYHKMLTTVLQTVSFCFRICNS